MFLSYSNKYKNTNKKFKDNIYNNVSMQTT